MEGGTGKDAPPSALQPPPPTPQTTGESKHIEGVVFVPCTPGGLLTRLLQEAENTFSTLHGIPKIRYVEMGGKKLCELLCRKNPWKGSACGRSSCWPCQGDPERVGHCHQENITYTITCTGCSKMGVTTIYTGESSRNMFLRGLEHKKALDSEDKDSVLWEHCQLHHEGIHQQFHMSMLRKHKSAFKRQVSEGVMIT